MMTSPVPSSKSAITLALAGGHARPLSPPPPPPSLDGATQLPFTHVSPEAHVVPQPPQLEVFDVTSMQLPLQSICPTVAQPQLPLVQLEPPGHAVQLVPQWAESVFELHAPSEHLVLPEAHIEAQMPPVPPLHTSPDEQRTHSVPQCIAFDATHEPEHRT
jgi:hypothetical protein